MVINRYLLCINERYRIMQKLFLNGQILLSGQFWVVLILSFTSLKGQAQTNPLEEIMMGTSPKIKAIYKNLSEHELQISYIQIRRDSIGNPQFIPHKFQQADSTYFYPASTVKLPVAILALEKLERLQAQGIPIDKHTPFQIIDPKDNNVLYATDSTHPNGSLTLGHLIKKIFVVSDNAAYNYLYDFLGKETINKRLSDHGITQTAIRHKFLLGADNENSWSYVFYSEDKDTLYHQKSTYSAPLPVVDLVGQYKGNAYFANGQKVNRPMDFSLKNWMSLSAQLDLVKRLFFPDLFAPQERFAISETNRQFLMEWMSKTPSNSQIPAYVTNDEYYDGYGKFFVLGDTNAPLPETLKIYNKVGYAYGTLTDVAYIVDKSNGIEFLLAATLLVNENMTFNDNTYEFEAKGIPFLAELGRQIYQYEMRRGSK